MKSFVSTNVLIKEIIGAVLIIGGLVNEGMASTLEGSSSNALMSILIGIAIMVLAFEIED
jgi:hypothetical protein